MSTNNESQCYFVQLQFDAYIDGDLSETQQESFLSHISACNECANEFRYAQTIQDGLLDLPLLDCSEAAVEQAQHIAMNSQTAKQSGGRWLEGLLEWLAATPPVIRYAFPAAAVAVIGLIALPQLQPANPEPPLAVNETNFTLDGAELPFVLPAQYSPTDIVEALNELNLAIEYLNQVSQRTEAMVGDRFLIRPLRDRLNASFERVRVSTNDALAGDQI
ncbi:MAG: zf-HC2 domain-containing protein [Pseudomonadales bacterium]|nr:zf-HC2 domain-containing protein [Pseudomonadales bacterium]